MYLTQDIKITKLADHSTAATSDVTSAELDMVGYDGVIFITSFGTAAANNLVTLHDSATTGTEAATVALKASGTSDEDVILDVLCPQRFCKLVASRGTSSTLESIWAIQYKARTKAVTNALSGTLAIATFTRPAAA